MLCVLCQAERTEVCTSKLVAAVTPCGCHQLYIGYAKRPQAVVKIFFYLVTEVPPSVLREYT